jgi:uncharacterized protein YjbI with pentapeptide repeats
MVDAPPADLTDTEQKLCEAIKAGNLCDFTGEPGGNNMADWGAERTIRASVLTTILRGDAKDWDIPEGATVELKGAVIQDDLGRFDRVKLPPISAEWCRFDGHVTFNHAIFTDKARFTRCSFNKDARFVEAVFEADARFDKATFTHANFNKVTVVGDAMFRSASFIGDPQAASGDSLCARFRRAEFRGDALFRNSHFNGGTTFERARFEGDARFGAVGDPASWVGNKRPGAAEFGGRAKFAHSRFDGFADFKAAVFGGGAGFYQASFAADADFYCASFRRGVEARFERAAFTGNAEFSGAHFSGRASFHAASFGGDAKFGGTQLAMGATFAGDATFYEARIAGHAEFFSTTFSKDARFDWMTCAGITLRNAQFGGASFLKANGLKAEIANLMFARRPRALWLKYAQIGTIKDNQAMWPEERCLTGCTYKRIQADRYLGENEAKALKCWPPARWLPVRYWHDRRSLRLAGDRMGVASRIEWLKGEPHGYDPFRYDQLIAAYRLAGMENNASFVALAKQRERRGTLGWPGKIWGFLQDSLVGYGYRLWLPIVWMGGLIAVGAFCFNGGSTPDSKPKPPSFESVYYATDLLFPVLNLGDKANFEFHDWRRWLAYAFMLAGWILAAAVVAGLQRLLSRRDN